MDKMEMRNEILRDIISKMKNSLADKMFPAKEDVADLMDKAADSPDHVASAISVEPHDDGLELSRSAVGVDAEPSPEEKDPEEEELLRKLMDLHSAE